MAGRYSARAHLGNRGPSGQRLARLLVLLALGASVSLLGQNKPNVIYILADDLGYGDLSCYGQEILNTPSIDRLAKTGMRFTSHYAGSTVCAPSRYVLMTGKHGGHAAIRDNGVNALAEEEFTLAELFKQAGYQTACVGKWGVGTPPDDEDPNRAGFDLFYGYVNMFHAHNYYPEFLIRNGKKERLANEVPPVFDVPPPYMPYEYYTEGRGDATKRVDYAPQLIHDEALAFIKKNKENPFFLFYSLNIPHANNEAGYDWSEDGKPIRNTEKNGMRVPDLGPFADEDWPIQEKGFARMIQYIDNWVGDVVELVAELGLAENTLIMFTSDNGPHKEGNHDHEFFNSNGDLKGNKRHLYEGGIRVPFIAHWTGTIEAGTQSDLMSGFQDMLPTFAEIVGAKEPDTDGISMFPTLTGESEKQRQHEFLYWEFPETNGKQALLYRNRWKILRQGLNREGPAKIELYDIVNDIGEENDVAEMRPDLRDRLFDLMMSQHTPYNERWDLKER